MARVTKSAAPKTSLRDRLIAKSTIDGTSLLVDSKVYGHKDLIPTEVPMINVALSGRIEGGLTPGLTQFAGPSKHFKTNFVLLCARSFMRKYPDGIILFYDSEFGTPESYFQSFGISGESVVHSPITDIEMLKFDIMQQLDGLTRDDKILIMVDSIGNLASKKEVEDALKQNSAADMTRAKQLKSLFRMVTPHLTIKDIPMVVVNHTYLEQTMFPKAVVSGGTGPMYSADTVWVIGRQQDKDKEGINGYHFIINIEKSRFVKEKTKIPITVLFEGGIQKWSGMFEAAIEGGYIVKIKNGEYAAVDVETGEVSADVRSEAEFNVDGEYWTRMLAATNFSDYVHERYALPSTALIQDEDASEALPAEEEE